MHDVDRVRLKFEELDNSSAMPFDVESSISIVGQLEQILQSAAGTSDITVYRSFAEGGGRPLMTIRLPIPAAMQRRLQVATEAHTREAHYD